MKKQKIPSDPHSEAALKWVIKNWDRIDVMGGEIDQVVFFVGYEIAAIIHLKDIIRKRQPLLGVKQQLAGIVRGKAKKPAKKKVNK